MCAKHGKNCKEMRRTEGVTLITICRTAKLTLGTNLMSEYAVKKLI